MPRTNTAVATISQQLAATTRVWLDETFPFDAHARVEWDTEDGPASSVASVTVEMRRRRVYEVSLSWTLDTPPDDVIALVREVCIEDDYEAHGCFAGHETSSAMFGAAEEGERYAAFREAMERAYEVKRATLCKAGQDHDYLRHHATDQEWSALEYVGQQSDDVETIELRNCACHSTLCRVVARVVERQDGAGNVTYRAPIAAGAVR
jgi:hypothetical protein